MSEPSTYPSTYPTEGADGTPHLTYYAHGVSFVWSGNIEHPIQACPGGYGEPVADTIWPDDHDRLREPWPAPLAWFRNACDLWLWRSGHRVSTAPELHTPLERSI